MIPDLAETHVPDELKKTIEAAMARYPDRRSAVMPALHAAQAVHGWCSPEALHQVAAVMQLTPAYLSMIASFYDMYNEEPVGRHHVYVCTSVACMPRQPRRVLEALQRRGRGGGARGHRDPRLRVPGRVRHGADGVDRRPLRRARSSPSDANEIVDSIRAGRKPLPGRGLGDPDYRLPWGGRA